MGRGMTSISGIVNIGEAQAARRDIARRGSGSYGPTDYYALIGLLIAGAGIGASLSRGPGMAIGVACAFFAYWSLANYLARRRARKLWLERGFPAEVSVEIEATNVGLSYRSGDVSHLAKWNVVTEIFPSRGYWAFFVQGGTWLVPRRFFTDEADERAFIRGVLQSMDEDARNRSGAARAFAQVA